MEYTYNISDADWIAVKHEVRSILIGLAKEEKTIPYGDLCRKLVAVKNLHPKSSHLHGVLYEISVEEYRSGRGLLSVLVVNQNTRMAGSGFYDMARDDLDLAIMDEEKFWIDTAKEVFAYWGKTKHIKC